MEGDLGRALHPRGYLFSNFSAVPHWAMQGGAPMLRTGPGIEEALELDKRIIHLGVAQVARAGSGGEP